MGKIGKVLSFTIVSLLLLLIFSLVAGIEDIHNVRLQVAILPTTVKAA
jgi:hypothetical protein